MAIKKYTASLDTTIVNAFQPNLRTRGTGANMGASDILEVFSIYGRQTTSSQELSRILVQFPVSDISSDRTAGTLPASGAVSFYLKLYNAEHSKTVPTDYTLSILAVSQSWQEGVGLDLETYKDETKGNAGSNWMSASNSGEGLAATATIQFNNNSAAAYDGETFTVTSTGGTSVVYTLDDDTTSNTYTTSTTNIGIQDTSTAPTIATKVRDAILNASNAHYGKVTAARETAAAAEAEDALKITGGTVNANEAFTVLVPAAAGGLAGDVTVTVIAKATLSTPSANQIQWHLTGNDATKIANLKLAINGTSDTSKVKFGSGITNGTTVGIKGITASDGTTSAETFANLAADNVGTAGNSIAITNTVGTVLVNESALTSGKLAGGAGTNVTEAEAEDALKITGGTVWHNDAFTVLVPTAAGGLGVTATVVARNSMGSTPGTNDIHWYLDPSGDAAKIANLKLAINGTSDTSKVKFGSGITNGATVGITGITATDGTTSAETYANLTADNAGTAGNSIAITNTVGTVLVNESALTSGKLAGGAGFELTLTQDTAGTAGNNTITTSDATDMTVSGFTAGASSHWTDINGTLLAGGSYHTGSSNTETFIFTQDFSTGLENLEVNVTPLVEQWIASTYSNYGVGIKLSSSYEAYQNIDSLDGQITGRASASIIQNSSGSTVSYYTKRFFARGTQYFFKRPVVEARWNDAVKDDRGNFYFSSSLAPGIDNMNTIYLYNYVRGTLKEIPGLGDAKNIAVSIYSGSVGGFYSDQGGGDGDNVAPSNYPVSGTTSENTGSVQVLSAVAADNYPPGDTDSINYLVVTGGIVSAGIYSASFAFTGSELLKTIYDVWFTGSDHTTVSANNATTQYFTGTIAPHTLKATTTVAKPIYYLNITNLKGKYRSDETARFNLYVRNKNWNPTIYTMANAVPESTTIVSASYRVFRTLDAYDAISYGTGSDLHTQLSYDVSGNYFDMDMNLLEPGYTYGLKFAFYDSELSAWTEQPEVFKFRVEDYEY